MTLITDTQLISAQLTAESKISDSSILKDLIDNDVVSELKQNMYYGVQYYKSKNTAILNRVFEYITKDNGIQEDKYRANNRLPHGFLKTLIDQKVNYCLGKPIILNNADNISKLININKFTKKMCKEASKKAVEWCHVYIDKEGKFKTINISGQEIIPVWDTNFQQELLQVIRYYSIKVQYGESIKDRYKVEIWDKEKVTFYMQDVKGNYYFDQSIDINPASHWTVQNVMLGNVSSEEQYNWGKVPFIPLWNNDEHETDLEPIKAFIDLYDKVNSDFGNNIEDFQEAVLKIVNYSGMSDKLDELIDYLKKYKILLMDEQGDANYLTGDIPIEARKEMLSILKDCIYEFGQGVNPDKLGDGNITNIVIKSRYVRLDLKANDTEDHVSLFLDELFWFCNKYLEISNEEQDNIDEIEKTFNRSTIMNEAEIIKSVGESKGIVSDKTAIKNHPWVNDVEEELKMMDEEKQKSIDVYGDNLNIDDSKNKNI
jgi:SPP1 family phage portal protein